MPTENKLTGYPSIDKPWLKYYSEEAINAPLPECTIYEYLWENNKDHLDDIALIYFGKKITYGELFENIDKAAKAFAALGIKKDEIVSVCMASTPETIYTIYALNKIGAIPDLLDPRTNTAGLEFFLKESGSRLLLTIDVAMPKFNAIEDLSNIENIVSVSPACSLSFIKRSLYNAANKVNTDGSITWNEFIKRGKNHSYTASTYRKSSLAAIVHTGGTTGVPKGVMLSDDSINSVAYQYRMMAHYNRSQMLLDIIPPFASYGLCTSIHMPLSLGLSVTLIPKFNPDKFGDLIIKYKPNYVMGVPSFWLNLLNNKKFDNFDLSFLVCAACGGDSMNETAEKAMNDFFASHNAHITVDKGYGMSEMSATAVSCYGDINKLGSVGIPMACNNACIVDPDTNEELMYDLQGEICLSGPGMMLGYYKNEELTEKTVKRHSDGQMWLHTGDLGHISKDGFLYHDGRIKRMIVRYDGFKIYPEAVEKVITENKAISNCAVVKKDIAELGIVAIAFLTMDRSQTENKDTIIKEIDNSCRNKLPERAVPYQCIFIDELPITSMGKVDYRALEKEAEKL